MAAGATLAELAGGEDVEVGLAHAASAALRINAAVTGTA
jgi:hypothetical protein